jgi:hypothetical protein
MSSEASMAGALAAAPAPRERRSPATPGESASPQQWDTAWQREMERLQAGAWFPGALPGHAGPFGALADTPPFGLAPRAVPAPASAQPHAAATAAPETAQHGRAEGSAAPERRVDRAERAEAASPAEDARTFAQPRQADAPVDDGALAVPESGGMPARAAAAKSLGPATEGLSGDGSSPLHAPLRDGATEPTPQAATATASGPAGLAPPMPAAMAAAPANSPAALGPGQALAGGAPASLLGTDLGAAAAKAPSAALLDLSLAQPPRAAAAMPAITAAGATVASPSAAGHAMPIAQEGAGTAGAASGMRTLASIERVLASTLGGTPGPRLHLSWDGQAVTVWLGVDGAVDPAALLRTVQNVLRQQGLQLSSLVCNGRTIVQTRPGQGQEPNPEHQEN